MRCNVMCCVSSVRGWCLISVTNPNTRLARQLHFSNSNTQQRNYYDCLGLTPKASQGDIKQAYYKLSLKFHPDKSQGESEKFREITSAYEVLGNFKLRRLYDRGALHLGHAPPSAETVQESVHINNANFEAIRRRQRVPMTGRTMEFNFDEWSKSHYGRVFEREKEKRRKLAAMKRMEAYAGNQGRFLGLVLFLAVTITVLHGVTVIGPSVLPGRPSPYDFPKKDGKSR